MKVVAVAPCQCHSPPAMTITSPGRMRISGPPRDWTNPVLRRPVHWNPPSFIDGRDGLEQLPTFTVRVEASVVRVELSDE